jgi:hypothetical protein
MKTQNTFHRILAFMILFSLVAGTSCSGDDGGDKGYTCATCSTSPQGNVLYDNAAKGLYKGIVVGSTGTISIDIQNGGNSITATLVLDGITAVLTSQVSVVEGQTYVAPFTGTYNGSPVSITFQVGASGSTPTVVSSDIPGHPNAIFQVFKETSTSMIEAFEGTLKAGNESGTFNLILSSALAKWSGVAKKDDGSTTYGSGNINSSGVLIDDDGKNIGKVSGDSFNGSFTDSHGTKVVLKGQRTL